ncbi:MAG: hypothetical protein V3V46_00830 [Anaerolineales bacterium]
MNKMLTIAMGLSLVVLTGCSSADSVKMEVNSTNPVTTPDEEEVGESQLKRVTNMIDLNVNACCVIPGNAYTAWWLIGDVAKHMDDVQTMWAAGWVANGDQINLQLALEAGGGRFKMRNTHDGVRIVILDHGPYVGANNQLSTPEGGCEDMDMCPVVFETAHAAP